MSALIGRWRGDRRGSVALEFAFAFPLIILLSLGTIELALMMLLDASLELGISEASRTGSLTSAGTEDERKARVEAIVNSWVGRWVPGTSAITVEIFRYPSLANINSPTWIDRDKDGKCGDGEGTCPADGGIQLIPGLGTVNSLVLYSVNVKRKGFTGIFTMIGITSLEFGRQTVVLNE